MITESWKKRLQPSHFALLFSFLLLLLLCGFITISFLWTYTNLTSYFARLWPLCSCSCNRGSSQNCYDSHFGSPNPQKRRAPHFPSHNTTSPPGAPTLHDIAPNKEKEGKFPRCVCSLEETAAAAFPSPRRVTFMPGCCWSVSCCSLVYDLRRFRHVFVVVLFSLHLIWDASLRHLNLDGPFISQELAN